MQNSKIGGKSYGGLGRSYHEIVGYLVYWIMGYKCKGTP